MPLDPPRPSFPSLNALRAFEAAARHEGFIAAGTELGVTPAAVAQQVKTLEAWVGRPLFHRRVRGLRLTAAAEAVLPQLTAAFDALGGAVHGLRAVGRPADIQIAALPSIAQLWLSPRLGALRKAFPALEFSVVAMEQPPDFARELFDFALFFAEWAPAGCVRQAIAVDRLTPVCAPGVLPSGAPAASAFAGVALLHDARWRDDWERWLALAGVRGIDPRRGAAVSLYSMAVEAAVAGEGAAIGHGSLVARHLADGRLVAPFADVALDGPPLSLIAPADAVSQSRIGPIADWLIAQEAQAPT